MSSHSMQKKAWFAYLQPLVGLLVALGLYSFSRALMWLLNRNFYGDLTFSDYLPVFIHGIRFDLSAFCYLNAPYIFITLVLIYFPQQRQLKAANSVIFYGLVNTVAIFSNLVDVYYSRFTLKRITADIFDYLQTAGETGFRLLQYLVDYWIVGLMTLMVAGGLAVLMARSMRQTWKAPRQTGEILIHLAIATLVMGLIVIGMRGGTQLKPVDIAQAGLYAKPEHALLVLNTPFTFLKTIGKKSVKEVDYFGSEEEAERVISVVQQFNHGNENILSLPAKKPNIAIIILEGISTENIGALTRNVDDQNYAGYTPFLDSLISKSIAFDGYANGNRSIEAVPAIISGIPSLMQFDFITSRYSTNELASLPEILRPSGYVSKFFHGGSNGTMGFDTYAAFSGFDKYYGRREYANDKDYDGRWGIFDEPFLQFMARELETTQQPFFAVAFTLSSHQPYTIPEKYKGKLKSGPYPFHQTVSYADEALRQFFRSASQMPWFANTLFIITSDHTSEPFYQYYATPAGSLSVPMIFYHALLDQPQVVNRIVQHIDLLPSLLQLLGYSENFIAFGTSAFDRNRPAYNLSYVNGLYQLIKDGYLFKFDGSNPVALYDLGIDPFCKKNRMEESVTVATDLTQFTKSLIQQYNYRLIHNRLSH